MNLKCVNSINNGHLSRSIFVHDIFEYSFEVLPSERGKIQQQLFPYMCSFSEEAD